MQRLFTCRQGDRAEYLAQYILSALAFIVPVPRQEDNTGVDFHCSLIRRDGGNLRPGFPFNIQIKKSGDVLETGVRYGGFTAGGNWRRHEIEQLCQTSLPYLIGLVTLDDQKLHLFSTITRYFILANWKGIKSSPPLPTEVALMPYNPAGLGDGELLYPNPAAKPQQTFWKLPMGEPIVSIAIDESENPDRCEAIKGILAPYLALDQANGVLFRIGLGYFSWPTVIRTGQPIGETASGLASPHAKSQSVQNQLQVMGRSVASLLRSYQISGMKNEILQWEAVLPQLPLAKEPDFVRNSIDEALAFARS